MTEAAVSFAGNLTDLPEVRYTEAGIARTVFRVAVQDEPDPSCEHVTIPHQLRAACVLASRALDVPQAAVRNGRPRSTAVTHRGP